MNKLEVKSTAKGAKVIDLKSMSDGDVIEVTKKFATTLRKQAPSKFKEGETYTQSSACVSYAGEDKVYMGLFGHYTKDGYETVDAFADRFDEVGGEGDIVRITCHEGFTKDKKQNKVVATDYDIELIPK